MQPINQSDRSDANAAWDGGSVLLGAIGGAVAVCTREGILEGATPAAAALLARLGIAEGPLPCAVDEGFWRELLRAPLGEPAEWRSPAGDACLGCTRYALGPRHVVLLMRDVLNKTRALSSRLHQQRLETIGLIATTFAHDLRGALSAIVFSSDVLASRARTLDLASQRQCADEIQTASRRLQRIVDQLLDFARIGPPMFVDVSVRELLENVSSQVRPVVRRNEHTLDVVVDHGAEWVRGNPLILEQIVANLALNAAEASSTPTRIVLRSARSGDGPVDAPKEAGGETAWVALTVTDDGPGIPIELRDKVFDPFFTTKSGGTGLGLTTAREAAWQLGGDLLLADSERGAKFVLVLAAGVDRTSAGQGA